MSKQVQVQKAKPASKRADQTAAAPTVNRKIAKLWFGGQS